jgi:hypothetical protein
MSSWEQILAEHQQQVIFRENCYRRLLELNAEKETEKRKRAMLWEIVGTGQLPKEWGIKT